MKAVQRKSGFTLAELLIVVAILAVLIAIMIPLINGQIEKANNAVDMSTMRAAYSVFAARDIEGEVKVNQRYYFNPADSSFSDTVKPAGYGKSRTNAKLWWTGNGKATGTPNINKHPSVLQLMFDSTGAVQFIWCGGEYSGLNVTNPADFSAMDDTQKIAKDKVLIDALQKEIRDMTYGELYKMFYEGEYNPNGSSYTDGGTQNYKQASSGKICFTIAESTILNGSPVVSNEDNCSNSILVPDLFSAVGYDINTVDNNSNYLINSVSVNEQNKGKGARIWVCLNISEADLKNPNNWDKKATKAYTYIKGSGVSTDSTISQKDRSDSKKNP